MRSYRCVRLGSITAGARRPDIVTRHAASHLAPYPARLGGVPARRMRTGAAMLELFGMADDWLPTHGDRLPAYGSQVHVITEALVLSSAGIVGLRTGEMLEDTLDHTLPDRDGYGHGYGHGYGSHVVLPAPERRLRGRYLSLLLGNHENHFHFLLMNLARIALLGAQDLSGLDAILVPAELRSSQVEALALAGLTRHAPLRAVKRGESLQVETLVLPWNVASGGGVNPVGVSWLRTLVRPAPAASGSAASGSAASGPAASGRGIYIDRRASPLRRLRNEDEVIATLGARGIEPVRLEILSLAEQALLLQQAALVVAPHGAGLTDMVFSSPGTRVVEILPSANLNWCYRHLAAACGHDYDCVLGTGLAQHDAAPASDDWIASPTHVLSAVLGGDAQPSPRRS